MEGNNKKRLVMIGIHYKGEDGFKTIVRKDELKLSKNKTLEKASKQTGNRNLSKSFNWGLKADSIKFH